MNTETARYVVTFDRRPVQGEWSLKGLRRMSLADAGKVLALAARIPKRGQIIDAATLTEIPS